MGINKKRSHFQIAPGSIFSCKVSPLWESYMSGFLYLPRGNILKPLQSKDYALCLLALETVSLALPLALLLAKTLLPATVAI